MNSVHKRKRGETQKIKEPHRTAQLLRFSGETEAWSRQEMEATNAALGKKINPKGTAPQACSFPFSSAAARRLLYLDKNSSAKGSSRLSAYF